MKRLMQSTLLILLPTKLTLLACSDDDPPVADGVTGGIEDCSEPPLGPMASNPDYRGTVTGMNAPEGMAWTSAAVGHIDSPVPESDCCEDYVLASDASSILTVVYGAPSNGLTVFSDEPDHQWSAGPAPVHDVALRDVTGDGWTDLIALLTDGTVSVRHGREEAPYFEDGLHVFPASAGTAVGRSQVLVEDVDCDFVPDVVVSSDEGFLYLVNDGTGEFGDPILISSASALSWLAVGDLDHDDANDVVAVHEDGTFSVWSNACQSFLEPRVYGDPAPEGTYEGARVALGRVCPGSPNSLSVITSIGDNVDVHCGQGSGSFDFTSEPHGQENTNGSDYRWRFDTPSDPEQRVSDISVVGGAGILQEIYVMDIQARRAYFLPPAACGQDSSAVAISISGSSSAPLPFLRLIPVANPEDPSIWERFLAVGGYGAEVMR